MTPTALADALRNVEIANEETNLAKFQSDAGDCPNPKHGEGR